MLHGAHPRTIALVVAVTLAAPACVAPLTHPLRATEGPIVQFTLAATMTSGDARLCYQGCVPVGNAVSMGGPQITLGYAHVFARHIGLMSGISTLVYPAGPSSLGAIGGTFVFVTLQNEYGSVGIGPELSVAGWGITMGAEWLVHRARSWRPALGVYARWMAPFDGFDESTGIVTPHRTLELGVRFRAGPMFAQYSYFAAVDGTIDQLNLVESGYVSRAVHVFALGVSFDGELFASVRARGAERRARRLQPPP